MAVAFGLVVLRQIVGTDSTAEFSRTADRAVEGMGLAKQSRTWFDQIMLDLRQGRQWRSWASQGPILGLYGLFLASGFSALTYQTAWHRMLGLFGGADSISASIVVGAFLFGLGIGSLVAGLFVDRLSRRQAMVWFALCEIGIASFAIVSPTLFYDVIFGQLLPLAQSRLLVFVVIFLGLLFPTMLMGFSLPLLSKAIVVDIDASARQIGTLYGVNTLGAGLGAFITGWLIIGNLGYDGAIFVAAVINLAIGIAGLALVRAVSGPSISAATLKPEAGLARDDTVAKANVLPQWCLLVFVSGFLIVALQIVWYRLVGVALQSNAYAFSLVLATLLVGDGLGLLVGARIVDRISDPRRFFFAMQAVATAIGVGVIYFAYVLFGLSWLTPGFVERDIVTSRPVDIASVIALTLLVVVPGSFVFGFSFPVVQKAVQRDLGVLGRRVGFVQLANILGNSMGSFGVGLLALHWWGSAGALRLVAIAGLIFALMWLRRVWLGEGSRIGAAGATLAAAALSCFVVLFPNKQDFWSRMHGVRPDQVAIVAEDRTGLAVLRINRSNFAQLFVQGHLQSTIPFSPIHAYLGVVGSLTHANPEQVLVIGVGGGGTPYAAGVNPLTRQIHAVEIVQPVIDVLHQYTALRGHSGVTELLRDPRFLIEAADGRHILAVGGRKYDVIEADAFYPKTSLSGLLYSAEFFHQVRAHLKAGGIYVQWSPTTRIIRTLRSVFPNVILVRPIPNVQILLASDRPIEFNGPKIASMLRQPGMLQYLEAAGIDSAQLEAWVAAEKTEVLNASKPLVSDDVNRDLFPRDEYYLNR